MDSKRVVNEIVKEFRKLDESYENGKKYPRKGKGWTKVVIKTLSGLGENKGYDVRPRLGRSCGAWLWDLCWRQRDNSESLVEIALAAESEWVIEKNLIEIKKDFEKLLVARASIRVMVYDARKNGEHTAKSVAEKLRTCVWKFNGKPGDVYLLIAAEGDEAPWKYFRITDQGKTRKPKLEQVSEQAKKNLIWKDRSE